MDDKYKERNIKRFKEFVYPDSYANECIADYKKKPYEICLLIKHFIIRKTPKGKILFEIKKEIISVKGNTHSELRKKIDDITLKMDGCLEGEWQGKWIPREIEELLDAFKKIKL